MRSVISLLLNHKKKKAKMKETRENKRGIIHSMSVTEFMM